MNRIRQDCVSGGTEHPLCVELTFTGMRSLQRKAASREDMELPWCQSRTVTPPLMSFKLCATKRMK
jgi:hypothetical protein